MKPNRPRDPDAERRSAETAREKMIAEQRSRAKELLSRAKTREEVLAAVHQAGAEIAASELPVDRTSHQPTQTQDQAAHMANLEALKAELIDRETARLKERDSRQSAQMAQRNADVDFVANEMKLHRATRYFSG